MNDKEFDNIPGVVTKECDNISEIAPKESDIKSDIFSTNNFQDCDKGQKIKLDDKLCEKVDQKSLKSRNVKVESSTVDGVKVQNQEVIERLETMELPDDEKGENNQEVQDQQPKIKDDETKYPDFFAFLNSLIASFRKKSHVVQILFLIISIFGLMYFSILQSKTNEMNNNTALFNSEEVLYKISLPYSMEYVRNNIKIGVLENGLKYFLIDNNQLKESAATFSMGVGMFHETFLPDLSEGVAHLLEHSIFMNINNKARDLLSYWNSWTDTENTQFTFSTSNKNFLKGFETYWKAIAEFAKIPEIRAETKSIENEFNLDIQNNLWIKNLLISSLSDNKSHPYSRFGTGSMKTLGHKGIEDEVWEYYQNFYSTENTLMVGIVNSYANKLLEQDGKEALLRHPLDSSVINISERHENLDALVEKLTKILNQNIGSKNELLDSKASPYNLPWNRLPGVLFLTTKAVPSVALKFQVKNFNQNQYEMSQNLGLICYYIDYFIKQKLQYHWNYAQYVSSAYKTYSRFSFLEVNIKLTELGRKFINNIVTVVFSAIHHVRKNHVFNTQYQNEYKKLNNMYFNLKPDEKQIYNFADKISDNIQRYGFINAISGDQKVTDFNKEVLGKIFQYLNINNMLLIITEDLNVNNRAKNMDIFDTYNLNKVFDRIIGKPLSSYDINDDYFFSSNVVLDQYNKDLKTSYHFQYIDDKELLQKWIKAPKQIQFRSYSNNQYVLSDNFLKTIRFREFKDFKYPIEYLDSDLKMAYYKLNDNYPHKEVYMNIMFKVQKEEEDSQEERMKTQAMALIISEIWNSKLQNLQESAIHARVDVSLSVNIDKIKLQITASEEMFETIVGHVMKLINIKGDDLSFEEISQATINVVRKLKGPKETFNLAFSYYESIIVNGLANSEEIIKYCENFTVLRINFVKPVIDFMFIEGSLKKNDSVAIAMRLLGIFKTENNSNWDLASLQNFGNGKKLPLYRVRNSNFDDPNDIYITGFNIGQYNHKNQTKWKVLSKIINDEAFIYLKEEKKLAYVTAAFLKLIDNQIVLNQFMEGERSSSFEGPVEDLLRIVERRLQTINFVELEDKKEVLRANLEDKVTEISEEGRYDSENMYLQNNLQVNIFKEKCLDELKNITADALLQEYRDKIRDGNRIIFEYIAEVKKKSQLIKEDVYGKKEITLMDNQ